jgi:hypothetical protein
MYPFCSLFSYAWIPFLPWDLSSTSIVNLVIRNYIFTVSVGIWTLQCLTEHRVLPTKSRLSIFNIFYGHFLSAPISSFLWSSVNFPLLVLICYFVSSSIFLDHLFLPFLFSFLLFLFFCVVFIFTTSFASSPNTHCCFFSFALFWVLFAVFALPTFSF